MKRHPLLIYRRLSERLRGVLLALLLVLLALGLYDLGVRTILGRFWILVWFVVPIVAALWFYYAVLVPRSALEIHRDFLRLRGPVYAVRISYGRILSVTGARFDQHHPPDGLSGRERSLLGPLYRQTCVLVELSALPRRLQSHYLWFPRTLFATAQTGLLLAVEDYYRASLDIEEARLRWTEQQSGLANEDRRSLAARVLDAD